MYSVIKKENEETFFPGDMFLMLDKKKTKKKVHKKN